MNTISFSWVQVYEANFGKRLNGEEVSIWEGEIRERVKGLREGEITAALRDIAETRRKNGERDKYAPTANNIITAVVRRRFEANKAREIAPSNHWYLDHTNGRKITEEAQEWQRQLRVADSPVERWSIICRPYPATQCAERESYCQRNNYPYEKFQAPAPITVETVSVITEEVESLPF